MNNSLRPGERDERAQALAPLFTWMREHGVSAQYVISRVYAQRGKVVSRSYASLLKRGLCPAPAWLIEDCCALLSIPVSVIYPERAEVPMRQYSLRRRSGRRYARFKERRAFLTAGGDANGTNEKKGTNETGSAVEQPVSVADSALTPAPTFSDWTVA